MCQKYLISLVSPVSAHCSQYERSSSEVTGLEQLQPAVLLDRDGADGVPVGDVPELPPPQSDALVRSQVQILSFTS